jgi:hypothetical protein
VLTGAGTDDQNLHCRTIALEGDADYSHSMVPGGLLVMS